MHRRIWGNVNKNQQYLLFKSFDYYLKFQRDHNGAMVDYNVWSEELSNIGTFTYKHLLGSSRRGSRCDGTWRDSKHQGARIGKQNTQQELHPGICPSRSSSSASGRSSRSAYCTIKNFVGYDNLFTLTLLAYQDWLLIFTDFATVMCPAPSKQRTHP